MNNFKKIGEIEDHLTQLTDILSIVKINNTGLSPIEKDIILQKLRDIYLLVLDENTKIQEEAPEEIKIEIRENAPIISETESLDERVDLLETPLDTSSPIDDLIEEAILPETEPEPLNSAVAIEEEDLPAIEPEPADDSNTAEEKEEPEMIENTPEQAEEENHPEAKIEDELSDMSSNEIIEDENKKREKQYTLDNDLFQFLPHEFGASGKEEKNGIEEENYTPQELAEEKELAEEPKETIEPEPKTEEKTHLAEPERQEIKPEKRSLNDLLNEGKEDKSVASKFQQTKVTDLAKAISLNDKFLYIKELFQNRGEEFSQAIQILNNCHTIEEAFNEMETMKKHYFWDSTSPAYLSFCDLLRRKFL